MKEIVLKLSDEAIYESIDLQIELDFLPKEKREEKFQEIRSKNSEGLPCLFG